MGLAIVLAVIAIAAAYHYFYLQAQPGSIDDSSKI